MLKKIIILFLAFQGLVQAQTRMYLEFNVTDPVKLRQLDEALRIGNELKRSLEILKKNSPNDDKIPLISQQISKYDEQMYKTYGLIPGLEYLTMATTGTINVLIPVNEVSKYINEGITVKAGTPTVNVKNSAGEDVVCFKIKQKTLNSRDSVQTFNQALRSAESIRQQIKNLELQLEKKPQLKKEAKLQEGMQKLKETLKILDEKLLQQYGIKAKFKYIFEPISGAVYLRLSEEDLKKLGELRKGKK